MTSAPERWFTALETHTSKIDDSKYILDWYSKSKDRARNPFQLRGFGESIRDIASVLIENLITLNVSEDEIGKFLDSFRQYISKNPKLNTDENALPKILEFYFKSGDYPLIIPKGKNILDLFSGDVPSAPDVMFPNFFAHFKGQPRLVLDKIQFQDYFYNGLDSTPTYVYFSRSQSLKYHASVVNRPDNENRSPYFFIKEINSIFDNDRMEEVSLAQGEYEGNRDKETFEFFYRIQVEKVFIDIILAMITHLKKYLNTRFYTDIKRKGDPDYRKSDDNILRKIEVLLQVLLYHGNINSFINPTTRLNGFKRAFNYFNSFSSDTDKLRALEIFYKKLKQVRNSDTPKSIGDFWDKFDVEEVDVTDELKDSELIIEKKFKTNKNTLMRSYKFRSDFDSGSMLIQGNVIDPDIIAELDKKIIGTRNFSDVVAVFNRPELAFWNFFKHLREFFKYDLAESVSYSRDRYLDIVRKQEQAYKTGEPIPSPDPFEEQWAEEVPKPLTESDLATPGDRDIKLPTFLALLERFKGNKNVKTFIEKVNGVKSSMDYGETKLELLKLMKEYEQIRKELVRLTGIKRGMQNVKDITSYFAVDSFNSNLHFLASQSFKKFIVETDKDGIPKQDSKRVSIQGNTDPPIKKYVETGEFDKTLLFNSDKKFNETINQLNPFFYLDKNGSNNDQPYFLSGSSQLCQISPDGTFILHTPPITDNTQIFCTRDETSIHTLIFNHTNQNYIYFKRNFKEEISIFSTASPFTLPKEIDEIYDFKINAINPSGILLFKRDETVCLSFNGTEYELRSLNNFSGFKIVPDDESTLSLFIVCKGSSNPMATFVYQFQREQGLSLVSQIPSLEFVRSVVYQKNFKRFVCIEDGERYTISLVENAIKEPLDQPNLPTNADSIRKWWSSVKGMDVERAEQYRLALYARRSAIDDLTFDTIDSLLKTGISPYEFNYIYIPMLEEIYKASQPPGPTDTKARIIVKELNDDTFRFINSKIKDKKITLQDLFQTGLIAGGQIQYKTGSYRIGPKTGIEIEVGDKFNFGSISGFITVVQSHPSEQRLGSEKRLVTEFLSTGSSAGSPAGASARRENKQFGGGTSSIVDAFINVSTKDETMKQNLHDIANKPSEDYKSHISYPETKPPAPSLIQSLINKKNA